LWPRAFPVRPGQHYRQPLDSTPRTAAVAAEAVAKNGTAVLADGATRTGCNLLKNLGLGPRAVPIRRNIMRAAVGEGSEDPSCRWST